jgi:hypothetical protein
MFDQANLLTAKSLPTARLLSHSVLVMDLKRVCHWQQARAFRAEE